MSVNSVSHAPQDGSPDEFISRVSHDLRTPLAAIKAAIGVILANEPADTPESLRRMFRNIDRAADQMASMLSNLAETVRLKNGPDALNREPVDLVDVARHAARTIEIAARRQEQWVELHIPSEPCLAVADAPRVQRALLNLLENAVRYGGAGTAVRLSLEARDGEAIFRVSDDGPGIPDGSAERILRGEPALTGGSGKSGLGLPVAGMIAELHGGRLWIDEGTDSTFCIALPTRGQRPSAARAQSRCEDGNE